MAKKTYIGINNIARQVKKQYIGVNNVARKVKKGYIGIGGVARPFLGEPGINYYGRIEDARSGRAALASASVGDYAIIAGGGRPKEHTPTKSCNSLVEAYDKSLVHNTNMSKLSSGRRYLSGNTIDIYALFVGGESSGKTVGVNTVEGYDKSLTKITVDSLSTTMMYVASASVGDHVLFVSGDSTVVNAYNKSLTRSNPTSFTIAVDKMSGCSLNNFAIFGPGQNGTGYTTILHAYNSSLTRSQPTQSSLGRAYYTGTRAGDYALFAGGYNGDYQSIVEVYDPSLVKTIATPLSTARDFLTAATINDFTLFAGGYNGSNQSIVEAYTYN